jgi:Fe-S oxidoreductase
LIDQAARVGSALPELTNVITQTPGLSRLAKLAAGMSSDRAIPRFAPLTLQQWFRLRGGAKNPSGPRVLLWPDTFNNHFHTDVGVAAVEALEAAGWQVVMPAGHVCCGRPLYDYGFLDLAERYLHRTLDTLREELRQGTAVVGMEPSCLAVFKDELTGMLPHDDDAARLARNAQHFSEFVENQAIELPRLERKALVWGHCHHKATGGMDAEHRLLERMGVEIEPVNGGCCGLAGSWGFEHGHHEISLECGEQALLPAVRKADPDMLVVADGFSCKTQIEQGSTGRRALHVAQVIKMAREHGPSGYRAGPPEQPYYEVRPQPPATRRAARLGVTGALAAGGLLAPLTLAKLARR